MYVVLRNMHAIKCVQLTLMLSDQAILIMSPGGINIYLKQTQKHDPIGGRGKNYSGKEVGKIRERMSITIRQCMYYIYK